jgi:phosphonate transport system permease protein
MKSAHITKWFLLIATILFILCLTQLPLEYARLVSRGGDMVEMFLMMVPPQPGDLNDLLAAALESWHIAVVGTVLAIVVSIVLAVGAAQNVTPSAWFAGLIKAFAALMRVIPVFIWALIFVVAIGLGPLAGIMAIAIHSLGMLIKVYAESIEEVEPGIIEALRSTGAGWWPMMTQAVIPSAMTSLMSWSIFRLEIDLRYSTVLGMVGAGGIGWSLYSAMRMYELKQAAFIILVMFAMVFVVEWAGARVKTAMLKGKTVKSGGHHDENGRNQQSSGRGRPVVAPRFSGGH